MLDPQERRDTARQEIWDWQLRQSSDADKLTAESISLMVEHGHEYAKQILDPMSYPTLEHVHAAIAEINPARDSELSLIADYVQRAMEIKTQGKGAAR